jgi:hypothetical protein
MMDEDSSPMSVGTALYQAHHEQVKVSSEQ